MTARTATLESLALELARAVQPLQDLLGPSFFVRLGAELPREISDDSQLLAKIADARGAAAALVPEV
jgi:hypothetical protein